jgi:hypothetical protein
MVRRRVASEKCSMAVGLRQCIRPSVESVTPGHDGCPLALVLINWTAWMRPFPRSGFESVGETHCHLYFPPADLAGTFFLNRDFKLSPQRLERDCVRSYIRPPMPCEPACWPKRRRPHSGAFAPAVARAIRSDREPACVAVAVRCVRPERRVFVSTYCPVY